MPQTLQYRNRMQVIRGGQPRVLRANRALHEVVVKTHDEQGRVPQQAAEWFHDLRRGRLRVYGSLLRYIDIAVETGTPKEVVDRIPEVIAAYIADCYEDSAA